MSFRSLEYELPNNLLKMLVQSPNYLTGCDTALNDCDKRQVFNDVS